MLNSFISRLSVRKKIVLIIFVLVIPLLAFMSMSLSWFSLKIYDSMENQFQVAKRSVSHSFLFYRNLTFQHAKMIARNPMVQRETYFTNTGSLLNYVIPLLKETNLDILTIHNDKGFVIAEAHNPGNLNANDSQDEFIQKALKGISTTAVEKKGTGFRIRSTIPIFHVTNSNQIIGCITAGYLINNAFAEKLKQVSGYQIQFAADNRLLASSLSSQTPPVSESTPPGPVIDQKTNYEFRAIPISTDSSEHLIVKVGLDHSKLKKTLFIMLIIVAFFFMLTTGFALIMAMKIGNNINSSINSVLSSTEEIRHQNYNIQVKTDSKDEFGLLANRFNIMARSIQDNFTIIREQTEEIRNLKNYYSGIIESMPSMIITINQDNLITQWNMAATEFTDIPEHQAIGTNLFDLRPDFQPYQKACREIWLTHHPISIPKQLLQAKKTLYCNVALYPLMERGLEGIVLRFDDITEIEKKETQLRQVQKMETIGMLAGGLAHDFNNVLGGITGSLSLINLKLSKDDLDPDYLKKYVSYIEKATNRAIDMVQQLMTLSRKKEPEFSSVSLKTIIREVLKICTNTFPKSIEIESDLPETDPIVKADPTQIHQVLLNLCINASHAMTMMRAGQDPSGGTLKIKVQKAQREPIQEFSSLNGQSYSLVDYWTVVVQDTGIGMEPKVLSKIFDPFFTTKEKGKGTGFGLAMVYNIIQQHHGIIEVDSVPGVGSRFEVFLPAASKLEKTRKPLPSSNLTSGEGWALVVDDEEMMREVAKAILEECGYEVLLAQNGEEGVSVFSAHRDEIKLILLDLNMPKMSGDQAFKLIKKMKPGVKVLLASGYGRNEEIEAILQLGFDGFVQKPYTLRTLARIVQPLFEKES